MGSATREALTGAKAALAALGDVDLATGEQMLQAGRVIGDSRQLQALLADASTLTVDKVTVIGRLFGGLTPDAQKLLDAVVSERWSTHDDLLAGIEEIGIRAIASSSSADIDAELFAFGTAVSSNAELELAIGSKLGDPKGKVALVDSLLKGKVDAGTLAIVTHLVQQPRGRRIGRLLSNAATIVADQDGQLIATVSAATALSAAQLERVRASLAATYGKRLKINEIVDPSLIGGLRIQIGDDVIDGTVSARLTALRLQLAS